MELESFQICLKSFASQYIVVHYASFYSLCLHTFIGYIVLHRVTYRAYIIQEI